MAVSCAVQLYKTMIMPIYDYSNFCLSLCLDKSKTKLQRLQIILLIFFRPQRFDRTIDLHARERLSTIDERREFDILKLFHKEVHFP